MGLSNLKVGAVVAVSDLDVAKEFYEGRLGLEPGGDETGGVRYECAEGTSLFVYHSPENAGTSGATMAGWLVDDLDSLLDALTARGVVPEQYDQPPIKTDERGVFDAGLFKAAWVKDPDGNTIALSQPTG
ncbi:MAG: hypothetical protein QOG62_1894 [Thermoleophilaceae bacterium]|jgi:catechol 2,3-dioxygenase-like lactoylglutathione lyase family enzyme|nr:hypothetical protein [Thermoleophilaceae bacterium]